MKDTASGEAAKGAGDGFLQKFLSLFTGGDPAGERKKMLRSIGKDLARSRFKFYRPKGQEALPTLAKFFYETYRVIAPAQVLLGNASGSGALRSFVIDSFLTEEQRKLPERLSEEAILEMAKTTDLRTLQERVKNDMTNYYGVFDGEKIRQIDLAYNTLLAFVNFVSFDFLFLLKKFDSTMTERNFSARPKFETINGEYIADDLMDFMEVFLSLDLDADWRRIFLALKEYRNQDIVQVESWQKLVPALAEIKQSQVLEMIVRHCKGDPSWMPQPRVPGERIVEPFLQKLRAQVETLIQRILQERRNSKIDEVAKQVFGTSVVVRMKNYTDKANVVFAKKMLGGYTQTQAVNYLKAYLIDYFKKEIRELVDLFLIRGKWTMAIQSQQLSDAYHALLQVADEILQFDDSLADDADQGQRIRIALAKADRDKEQMKYVRQLLKQSNDKALALVNTAAVNLIALGRHFKGLIEDFDRPTHETLINWKEIEGASERSVKERLVADYKRIYYMVQLLQYFAKEVPGS